MDTSEVYIDQCSKAGSLQRMRKSPSGFCSLQIGEIFSRNGLDYLFDGRAKQPPAEGTAWLPRQDQLQEILKPLYDEDAFPTSAMLRDLSNRENDFDISPEDRSMEQAWLALVMEALFGMTWNSIIKTWVRL